MVVYFSWALGGSPQSARWAGKRPKTCECPWGWSLALPSFPFVFLGLSFPIYTESPLLPTRGLHLHTLGTAALGVTHRLSQLGDDLGDTVGAGVSLLLTYPMLSPSRPVVDDS